MSQTRRPEECRFRLRCVQAIAACTELAPALLTVAPGHQAACHLLEVELPLHAQATDPNGRLVTIADFAFPEQRVAIYVDGASIHLGEVLCRDRRIEH